MSRLLDAAALPACARPVRAEPLPKHCRSLKASTALVGLTLLFASIGLLGMTSAVMAEGGTGGVGGGPGGNDEATAPGGPGISGSPGGGGGGGAGQTGGDGGAGPVSSGGTGGASPGAAGSDSGSSSFPGAGAGGGGGGAHGYVNTTAPSVATTGGKGGNGGEGMFGAGGGGGAGGWGAVMADTGGLGTLASAATGGNGGNGGHGDSGAGGGGSGGHGGAVIGDATTRLETSADLRGGHGGNGGNITGFGGAGGAGGAGGHGLLVTGASTVELYQNVIGGNGGAGGTSTNGRGGAGGAGGAGVSSSNGAVIIVYDGVTGGNGGAGGSGSTPGANGAGGAGIAGNNVTIVLDGGGIAGGLNGDGSRTYALSLSGDSKLTIARTGTASLFGGIQLVSGTLTLDQAGGIDVTIANAISGAGGLRKTGAGMVTLTDANTYTGGTTISGGTLQIGDGGTSGSILGDIVNNGQLIFNRSNSISFNGAISGTGGLTKQGAGALILSGTNTYSGATTIEAGAIFINAAPALSAASDYSIASGARLEISDGLGIVTAGSLAGAGTIQISTGTKLKAGSSNASTTFSGTISGNGSLDKTGTGTLTLTGTNTYTGGTKVSGGKLVVNGSITGAVTLSGGTLGGSGTIGGISVASGATVAPGNSIGTLNVSGNVAFASGSTYQVEVNAAGQSDRIAASGSATITGGRVEVLAQNGNYAAATNYTILTASGGVTGSFTSVSSNLAFLTPSLGYGGTSVTLTMTRNDTGFGPGGGDTGGGTTPGGGGTTPGGSTSGNYIAQTRNQGFIANAAEALGVGNPVYDALISATAAEARAGFDLLSGEAHAQAVSVMVDESRLVRESILNRLRGPLLTQPGQQVAAAFSADLPGRKGAVTMAAPVPQPRYTLWGEAFGSAGNTDADGNAASLSRRSGGALLGADVMLYDAPGSSLKVGVAGGYSQSRFDLDARLSSGKLESGHAALYAGARFGSLRFDAGAAYSWSESDIRRQVAIRGFGDLLRLQRPGSVLQGFAELGYGFAFSGFALEPFAQLALLRVSTDAGTEQGGAAALRVLSSDQTLGFTTLGLRAEAQLGTMPLFARAMLGWRHGFGELTPQARTAFALGTNPAVVFAAPIDRNALTAEAGLDWRISQATALGLTYSAAIGERSRDHALKGRIEMRF
ncbi:autotransporter domain-containing protein [Bosea sp. NPDC055332]